ncbi:hypothetical protein B566_EDAN002318 [Ephemera danica]|nr:hypothetical protein B566_EDAN002318 [Ephemera danica]
MSLYDDLGLDGIREKAEQVAGWSSSIKLLQSQMQLKKTSQIQQFSQPRRDQHRKPGTVLAPVIDLKKPRRDDDEPKNSGFGIFSAAKESKSSSVNIPQSHTTAPVISNEQEWIWDDEYDPMWPNDYEKVVKDLREKQDREREREEDDRKRKNREDRDRKSRESVRSRYDEDRRKAGFAGRPESDEEEEETPKPTRAGGVAIAPPPSLQESSNDSPKRPAFTGESFGMMGGSSVAAKIMAKYGFKEGQGLGKKEQGIAMALQVEKTSKRGGRIISDKESMMVSSMNVVPPGPDSPNTAAMAGPSMSPPPPQGLFNAMPPPAAVPEKPEPSITEMMKNPSKVVLLRNMVGPGEVDEDLEPEVKDECNTKYGDVIRVIIYEVPNVPSDEAVRIFVEFKRIEAAIKAVVDLNGRFFGGRQVKAGFYSWEKLNNLELL